MCIIEHKRRSGVGWGERKQRIISNSIYLFIDFINLWILCQYRRSHKKRRKPRFLILSFTLCAEDKFAAREEASKFYIIYREWQKKSSQLNFCCIKLEWIVSFLARSPYGVQRGRGKTRYYFHDGVRLFVCLCAR